MSTTSKPTPREHLAWLMWCHQQGYLNPADRAILTNWITEPDDQLHPDDIKERTGLLTAADEVLALLAEEATP